MHSIAALALVLTLAKPWRRESSSAAASAATIDGERGRPGAGGRAGPPALRLSRAASLAGELSPRVDRRPLARTAARSRLRPLRARVQASSRSSAPSESRAEASCALCSPRTPGLTSRRRTPRFTAPSRPQPTRTGRAPGWPRASPSTSLCDRSSRKRMRPGSRSAAATSRAPISALSSWLPRRASGSAAASSTPPSGPRESSIRQAPFRESGYRYLMEALAARGNAAEALNVYETLRTLLREELGATPSPATQDLHRALLG